jgi:hypothetical protein
VFDYFVDASRAFPPEFRAWTEVVPPFTYRRDVPYFQMLVRAKLLHSCCPEHTPPAPSAEAYVRRCTS